MRSMMTKMQEAFDSWMDHDDWRFADREAGWKWMYEAGYQASIADVKAGGAVAWLNKKVPHMAVLTKPDEGGGWFPVIKLPEDV